MKLVLSVVDKVTKEEFLARAVQMDQKGRITHVSIEASPNTTWEDISQFHVVQINTEMMGGII